MPYINLKTSAAVTQPQKTALFSALGKAIEAFPGKSERWLMVDITDQCSICFAGDENTPAAMVDVKVFGSAAPAACEKMTQNVCKILNEVLNLPQDRVYVCYKGYDQWGWNGGNF